MRFLKIFVILVILLSVLSFSAVTYKDGKVVFTFKTDMEAKTVYLAGNFNNWNSTAWQMKLINGIWTYEVELKPGSYQYKYVIDGKVWKEDLEAPAFVDDGFGGKNSLFILTSDGKIIGDEPGKALAGSKNYEINMQRQNTIFVDPDGYVVIRFYDKNAKYVFIAGSFNNWNDKATECYYIEDGWWEAVLEVTPGVYEYKFVVDGKWVTDPNAFAYLDDGFGGKNGVFELVKEGAKLIVRSPAVDAEKGEIKQLEKMVGVRLGVSVDGRNVVFAVKKQNAQEVYLAGSFNQWNPRALKMKLIDGYWVASLALQPGVHKYKFVFVVGGTDSWEEDPNAPSYEPDGFGGKNSVFKLFEKDGNLIIEGVEQQASGLPVKGAYEFAYKFKTHSTNFLISSGFTNSLTLEFQPMAGTIIGLKYGGATISQAVISLSQNNYTLGLHYNSPWALLSSDKIAGNKTGVLGHLKLSSDISLIGGLGYENNELPWIVGISGKVFKIYVSNKYFSDSIALVGEINFNVQVEISISGMYSFDNNLFASAEFIAKQFGLYTYTDLSNFYGEVRISLEKDTLTIGGNYDISSNQITIFGSYNTSDVSYYLDTDLSKIEFKVTFIEKNKDIGFGVKTDLSNILGNTEFSLFGRVKF